MKTYTYPVIAKIIYRYANFPITLLLFFYVIISAAESFEKIYFLIPLIINLIIIFLLNRHYYRTYKVQPFNIKIDNNKMICTDYYLSRKSVELRFTDITEISGGIFTGSQTTPLYLISDKSDTTIKINHRLINYKEFLTTVLQNINQELYDSLLERMKNYAEIKSAARRKEKKQNKYK